MIACRFSYVLHWNQLVQPSSPENGRTVRPTRNAHQRDCMTARCVLRSPDSLSHVRSVSGSPYVCLLMHSLHETSRVSASGGATTSGHRRVGSVYAATPEASASSSPLIRTTPRSLGGISILPLPGQACPVHALAGTFHEARPAPSFSDAD